jgi:hypothetical protein
MHIYTYIYNYEYLLSIHPDGNGQASSIQIQDDYMNNYSTECVVLKWMDNALLTIQNTLHGNVYTYIGIYTLVLVNVYSYIYSKYIFIYIYMYVY